MIGTRKIIDTQSPLFLPRTANPAPPALHRTIAVPENGGQLAILRKNLLKKRQRDRIFVDTAARARREAVIS
jgi:hypothetical protein